MRPQPARVRRHRLPVFVEDRNDTQRTGFAVRTGLTAIDNGDFAALALDGSVRRGVDITVTVAGQPIRLLSVHLKSGCFDVPLSTPGNDCGKLLQQVPLLEGWIDQRTQEGMAFAILGDWNRRFDAEPARSSGARSTTGYRRRSTCSGRPRASRRAVRARRSSTTSSTTSCSTSRPPAGWWTGASRSSSTVPGTRRSSTGSPTTARSGSCWRSPGKSRWSRGAARRIRRLLGEIMQRVERIGQLLGED
jgi:hypothetical protein